VVGSWWHLTLTFDLESYFRIFFNLGYSFRTALRGNVIFGMEIQLTRSLKVINLTSRSRQWQGGSLQSKTTGQNYLGLIGMSVTITLEAVRSFWHFDLDLWPWDVSLYFSSIQALSFECLKLAVSLSAWRYIFRISRSPSCFKVMKLISRSRSQNSGCAQVCAPFGHSLICYVLMLVTVTLVQPVSAEASTWLFSTTPTPPIARHFCV